MESPNKRQRLSAAADDYVALGGDEEGEASAEGYGYHDVDQPNDGATSQATEQQHNHHRRSRNAWNDPRNAKDRPKSKHALPGVEPWILVKTKYGRRFVHNPVTKESFWFVPQHVLPAVREFEEWERQQKEKEGNAKWAEAQLQEMRQKSQAEEVNAAANQDPQNRRRRSESLQREDEAAMMAELDAEAEKAEEKDVRDVVKQVEPLQPVTQRAEGNYDSESSYEEVEVTDSEFEDDEDSGGPPNRTTEADGERSSQPNGPVEFGEDDIAYQLRAMEESYNQDVEEDDAAEDWDEDDAPDLTQEDAANLFRDMLDDNHISPFTPWDKLITDESDTSIIMDDRYTVLPNMKTRKEVWEAWVKDTAARLKEERAQMEKLDPRIPYLAFLADKATPKLYWPEFKRKFKKEAEMNDRNFGDKERERLYRDHIARLKLPESTRKADLVSLLQSVPRRALNGSTSIAALPSQVLSHLHFISLPNPTREAVITEHISRLATSRSISDGDEELTGERRAEEEKKREERRRREQALADRARKVDEERKKAEKQERWARNELREEERELRRAMDVGRGGIKTLLERGE